MRQQRVTYSGIREYGQFEGGGGEVEQSPLLLRPLPV